MTSEDESDFDEAKAELFEAVGHPNRIKILNALDPGSMGFAELKKKVGMESSGHLSFHLGKLEHLVALNANGQYVLTGEGREALRMIHAARDTSRGGRRWDHTLTKRSIAALIAVLLVALAVVAVQQAEIASLSARPPGTLSLNGRDFWYSTIPLAVLPLNANTSVLFDGVNFTFIPGHFGAAGLPSASVGSVSFTVKESNLTRVQVGRVLTFALVVSPDILVRFSDGKAELASSSQVITVNGTTSIFFGLQSWRWFSSHVNPQVAISENSTEITLFVSVGH